MPFTLKAVHGESRDSRAVGGQQVPQECVNIHSHRHGWSHDFSPLKMLMSAESMQIIAEDLKWLNTDVVLLGLGDFTFGWVLGVFFQDRKSRTTANVLGYFNNAAIPILCLPNK